MKISIITPVFNRADTVEDCIRSVLNQRYNDIEYIIVDGGSTDGTLEVINKYRERISKIISEPDNGIYDAMNKGIKNSTGDVIGFLNSDDIYADENVISDVMKIFKNKNVDSVYGDLVYVDKYDTSKIIRMWKSGEYKKGSFKKGWMPPHPTFFVKREVYEKFGCFNLNFKIAADYELMLRFLEKNNISTFYLDRVLVKMRWGGNSNRNLYQILKANLECYRAFKHNGIKVSPFIVFYKPISKIKQFFNV